ncbi:PTPRM [Balamuthia mandrillaris]
MPFAPPRQRTAPHIRKKKSSRKTVLIAILEGENNSQVRLCIERGSGKRRQVLTATKPRSRRAKGATHTQQRENNSPCSGCNNNSKTLILGNYSSNEVTNASCLLFFHQLLAFVTSSSSKLNRFRGKRLPSPLFSSSSASSPLLCYSPSFSASCVADVKFHFCVSRKHQQQLRRAYHSNPNSDNKNKNSLINHQERRGTMELELARPYQERASCLFISSSDDGSFSPLGDGPTEAPMIEELKNESNNYNDNSCCNIGTNNSNNHAAAEDLLPLCSLAISNNNHHRSISDNSTPSFASSPCSSSPSPSSSTGLSSSDEAGSTTCARPTLLTEAHVKSIEKEFARINELYQKKVEEAESLGLFASATTRKNFRKNRYHNILAQEHTRVKLQSYRNFGIDSDYINANFINGEIPGSQHAYISCQAPLPNTMLHFWLMVWENKCAVILMLTRLTERERPKADLYWPELVGGSCSYGPFTVTFDKSKLINPYLEMRTFTLELDNSHSSFEGEFGGEKMRRQIVQFHYTEWPDFGIPKDTTTIRHLVRLMDLYKLKGKQAGLDGPVVAHCSAGVGRTGTFIAVHVCLEKMKFYNSLDQINIPQTVLLLRQSRSGMVQTQEQYRFIYEAVKDARAELQETAPKVFPSKRSVAATPSHSTASALPIVSSVTPSPSPSPSSSSPSSSFFPLLSVSNAYSGGSSSAFLQQQQQLPSTYSTSASSSQSLMKKRSQDGQLRCSSDKATSTAVTATTVLNNNPQRPFFSSLSKSYSFFPRSQLPAASSLAPPSFEITANNNIRGNGFFLPTSPSFSSPCSASSSASPSVVSSLTPPSFCLWGSGQDSSPSSSCSLFASASRRPTPISPHPFAVEDYENSEDEAEDEEKEEERDVPTDQRWRQGRRQLKATRGKQCTLQQQRQEEEEEEEEEDEQEERRKATGLATTTGTAGMVPTTHVAGSPISFKKQKRLSLSSLS